MKYINPDAILEEIHREKVAVVVPEKKVDIRNLTDDDVKLMEFGGEFD